MAEIHKRFYRVDMCSQCCWSRPRLDYYEGKMHAYSVRFHVTEEQRKEIQGRIERDAQWMSDHGLMDYSLVVGIAEQKEGRPFPAGSDDQQPYVSRVRGPDGKAHTIAYYIGIIDFLQEWTATKCAAPPSLPALSTPHRYPSPLPRSWVSEFDPRFLCCALGSRR